MMHFAIFIGYQRGHMNNHLLLKLLSHIERLWRIWVPIVVSMILANGLNTGLSNAFKEDITINHTVGVKSYQNQIEVKIK